MSIEKRLGRDFGLFYLFFVPGSFIMSKLSDKNKKKYWQYVPIFFGEGLRLGLYYKIFESYIK
jgi:hypothetical protein